MTFPYTGWVLMPSFKPAQVTFVSGFDFAGREAWHESEKGKSYSTRKIYSTKSDAIGAGFIDLKQQQDALDKKQLKINKRLAALEKAAGEAKP